MGKLRLKPRGFHLEPLEHRKYFTMLHDAQKAANDHRIYWDPDPEEDLNFARKAFQFVAERESMDVTIRRPRNSDALEFVFQKDSKPKRLPSEEYQALILEVLASAGEPLSRRQIVEKANLQPHIWTVRINELLKNGKVLKEGERIKTRYFLPE